MRAKKLLALALAGMILAGCLSGCDRTIIEHQFHTNTVTDTEYIEVGNSGSQQTLLTNFSRFMILGLSLLLVPAMMRHL